MTRLVLFGAGRMAAAFAEQVRQSGDVELSAVIAPKQPEWLGDVTYFRNLDELPELPGVLVDFTLPDGTTTAAAWCAKHGVALLSGVTGLQPTHFEQLRNCAQSAAVLWSPNLSIGVNLLAQLARQASAALPKETAIHIHDVHHQHKKDAPSGTALFLGEAISTGNAQRTAEYSSQRIGEVIGEHCITFSWAGEEITLAHEARDRAVFARGALLAARWLALQPPGYYSAADWLQGQT